MKRRTDVEIIRLLSAFGIVYFHSGIPALRETAYGGLIFFTITSAFYARSNKQTNKLKTTVFVAKKTLIPTAIWSTIYLILYATTSSNIPNTEDGILLAIIKTPTPHLWYLPFIFAATTLIKLSNKTILIATTITALAAPAIPEEALANLQQYTHAIPAIGIGIIFSLVRKKSATTRLFIILATAFYIFATQSTQTYITGLILATPLLTEIKLPQAQIINTICKTSLTIYLIHPILLAIINRINSINGILIPTTAFIASVLIAIIGDTARTKLSIRPAPR